jgi:hypothetical protein
MRRMSMRRSHTQSNHQDMRKRRIILLVARSQDQHTDMDHLHHYKHSLRQDADTILEHGQRAALYQVQRQLLLQEIELPVQMPPTLDQGNGVKKPHELRHLRSHLSDQQIFTKECKKNGKRNASLKSPVDPMPVRLHQAPVRHLRPPLKRFPRW